MSVNRFKLTYTQIIAFGFLALILLGTLLLCLPIASRDGQHTSFVDSLFTATSATCVTGLIVFDTWSHWTLFGQIVILSLIQIGGLGFMTVISMFFLFAHKHISLGERKLLMQSAGSMQLSDVINVIKKALLGTLIIEGTGAVLLFIRFIREMPFARAVYFSVFHSVSAFCNAGFDLMSAEDSSSFINYSGDVWINLILMALIILGGLGFFVWNNIINCRFRFRRFDIHTKVVLAITAFLILSGTLLIYIAERNHAFSDMGEGEKWLSAAFHSITTRTAGFSTVNMSSLSESGSLISVVLMMIGGSPGSTAGGIKTTTVAILLAATISCARNRGSTVMFKRRIDESTVRQATAIVVIYLFGVLCATALISAIESVSLSTALFEVGSAIATVGLSKNLTPTLCIASKLIITFLMYAGRLGGLSLVIALAEKRNPAPTNRPLGKIMIG